MNSDIRVKITFLNNIKVEKLIAKWGRGAGHALVVLWLYAATNNPDGVFNLSKEDMAMIVKWDNDFIDSLVDLNFLEEIEGGYMIHEWEEHNTYAANSETRVEKAKKAANTRWHKEELKEQPTQTIPAKQPVVPAKQPGIPIKQPIASKYEDNRTYIPIQQKHKLIDNTGDPRIPPPFVPEPPVNRAKDDAFIANIMDRVAKKGSDIINDVEEIDSELSERGIKIYKVERGYTPTTTISNATPPSDE